MQMYQFPPARWQKPAVSYAVFMEDPLKTRQRFNRVAQIKQQRKGNFMSYSRASFGSCGDKEQRGNGTLDKIPHISGMRLPWPSYAPWACKTGHVRKSTAVSLVEYIRLHCEVLINKTKTKANQAQMFGPQPSERSDSSLIPAELPLSLCSSGKTCRFLLPACNFLTYLAASCLW